MNPQSKFEGRYSVRLQRGAGRWGWSDVAVDFGIGDLHIGPVTVRFTWPVVWPY